MSTSLLPARSQREYETAADESFPIDMSADSLQLPAPHWLTQLKLQKKRRDLRCLPSWSRIGKRVADIVVAGSMLVMLSPVMAAVALLVKLTSPGPVIFRQQRVGVNLRRSTIDRRRRAGQTPGRVWIEDRRQATPERRNVSAYGKPFVLYKFRTMRIDAEKAGARFAQKNDPRITPIGRFLRKSRLDELPQLWNVLRGEMSMVGPRPERPEFIGNLTADIPDYPRRLGLKPGLTGVAQIENGYDNEVDGFRRKVAFDLIYLQNCCLRNDLKILFRTIRVVLTGKGAL